MHPIAFAVTSGWASGLSAYGTVLVIGLAGRAGLVDAPGAQRTDVLIVMAVFTAVEFVVDKIPYVDSLWDTVHTFVRPTLAAVIGWHAVTEAPALEHALLAALAGLTALGSHVAKAGVRLAVNAAPNRGATVALSAAENALLLGVLLLATAHPWPAAATAIGLLAGTAAVAITTRSRAGLGWSLLRRRYFPDPYDTR